MIKRIQLLVVLLIFLFIFDFAKNIREGGIIHKTLSYSAEQNSSSDCNSLSNCTPIFSSALILPTPTLGIPENKITENVPVDEKINAPVQNDYCLTVPVLTYHRIQPQSIAVEKNQTAGSVDNEIFDQQMAYLSSSGYSTITAEELINALRNHTGLPAKSVVITLDDGYENAYTYAYLIAQKYQIKLNLMIATGLVGNQDFLIWDQIKEMRNSGLVYFTNHTWSHYAVGNGSYEKIQYEIQTAKGQLEQYTGQTINIFTYPYGSFSPNAIQILQQDGFIGGFSTIPGKVQCESYIMTLHRTSIGNSPLSSYGL
ncbi:MAG: polysaccharide deacetylase family protein [Candidatus Levybacteria bacterium]|nr:polysaccharide deacetylase family protein [Candidatus Levybacteria bacterium]